MYLQYVKFIEYVNKVRMNYRTNNVIITMGGDFTYMEANPWFYSIDALIR